MSWFWKKILKGQTGSTTTTGLLLLSGVAATTAAITDLTRRLKQTNESKDENNLIRRANETALSTVSQLVNSGLIHFNAGCNRIEPAQISTDYSFRPTNDNRPCGEVLSTRAAVNCNSDDENDRKWIYTWNTATSQATLQVCVRTTFPARSVNTQRVIQENPRACQMLNPETISCSRRIDVTVNKYETGVDERNDRRYFAHATARPTERDARGRFFASLKGRISLGLTSGNIGLVSRHGAADTCFYMRPKSDKQARADNRNLAFFARTKTGNFTLNELEVRPSGPNADEFQGEYDVSAKAPEAYEVLKTYRDGLIQKYYKQDFRGHRPASGSWDENNPQAFVPNAGRPKYVSSVISELEFTKRDSTQEFLGVQPNIPNGPQFQYFLAARPGTSEHHQSFRSWDSTKVDWYKQGCATSAGDGTATFCTRVDIPLKRYQASVSNKCKPTKRTLPAGEVLIDGQTRTATVRKIAYVNRAIQTSCDPRWIARVEEVIAQENQVLNAVHKPENETTAAMAIAALEVDDNFLRGTGIWSNHPLRNAYSSFRPAGFPSENSRLLDDYTIAFESADPTVFEKVINRNEKTVDNGDGTTKTVIEETTEIRKVTEGSPIEVDVYAIDELRDARIETVNHDSKSCAYFKYYEPENAKSCRIEYITRNNAGYVCRNNDGCFDAQTKIRMADGSDRLITDLKLGERVFNPVTKQPAKIVKLTIGPENKPLLQVSIGGSTVRVTDTHPFMTKQGWVAAKRLKKGELVLAASGQYVPVDGVTLGSSGRIVANLALEGSAADSDKHYVLADGVVTGDLVIQNMLESKAAIKEGTER